MNDMLNCSLPTPDGERILLAHGEGARWSRRLVREVICSQFDNPFLHPLADGAILPAIDREVVMTTDSYVVSPLFFPGGDIGKLAVYGTVNDLAVCGAEPLYLSLAFILEEGLPIQTLRDVVASIQAAAVDCRVMVVTGDTKVVPRGAADRLFINTTGLGRLRSGTDLGTQHIRPGDRILVSGTLGDHGIAILAAREHLGFESILASDTAPLAGLVADLLSSGARVRFLRDPTRGGVSAALHEVAVATGLSLVVNEPSLPLSAAVRGACELLGLDPLFVANEGKLLAIVAAEDAAVALTCLRQHPLGTQAADIGEIGCFSDGEVLVRSTLEGVLRVLDEPSGAPLPRIC